MLLIVAALWEVSQNFHSDSEKKLKKSPPKLSPQHDGLETTEMMTKLFHHNHNFYPFILLFLRCTCNLRGSNILFEPAYELKTSSSYSGSLLLFVFMKRSINEKIMNPGGPLVGGDEAFTVKHRFIFPAKRGGPLRRAERERVAISAARSIVFFFRKKRTQAGLRNTSFGASASM